MWQSKSVNFRTDKWSNEPVVDRQVQLLQKLWFSYFISSTLQIQVEFPSNITYQILNTIQPNFEVVGVNDSHMMGNQQGTFHMLLVGY